MTSANTRVAVVIPALNEETTIAAVVHEVHAHVDAEVIVVDNGSTDGTAGVATGAGARVVSEPTVGYGRACMAGIAAARDAEIIVFMDGDGSDVPGDIPRLTHAIAAGAELAIGVRTGPGVEPRSMTLAARFGNWLCGWLLLLLYGRRLHDLSPLKAIRRSLLDRLALSETTYGWTVELLASSLGAGASVAEVEVGYRPRAGGVSKVSGNLRAATRAGMRILATIGRLTLAGRRTAVFGVFGGVAVAIALLVFFAIWLLSFDTTGPRALAAVWLVAWPLLLVGICAGYALARLASTARARGHNG